MKLIRKWLNDYKAKTQLDKMEQIRSNFGIKERKGVIWILHNGYAVEEMPSNASAEKIASALEKARITALKYEGYE